MTIDIISIVNAMQPNTISCFALNPTDFPNGGTGTAFMGGYAQLFHGATLPSEAAVTAYESTYASAAALAASTQALVSSAMAALTESDKTMLRVQEAISLGLTTWTTADVVAWVNYRRSLRTIISSQSGTIPTKPAYPANT